MPNIGNSSNTQMLTAEEQAAADHMRYVAVMQRRASPPRCHPVTIVLLVMSGGLVFIGLTMTIIAHWPGSTSIGENPLKVAGPILLSVGAVGFIVGIALVGVLNKRDRKKFVKSVNTMAQSRVALSQSQQSLSAMNNSGPGMRPNKATAAPVHDDSMATSYTGAEPSLRPSHMAYGEAMRQTTSSKGTAPGYSSSGADDGDDIPQPVRVRKPRKPAGGSKENLAGGSDESKELLSTSSTRGDVPPSYDSLNMQPEGKNNARDYTDDTTTDSGKDGAEKKKKKKPPAVAPKPPTMEVANGGQGEDEAYRLRVHVKPAPGAIVSIRQGSKENIHNKSTASIETDF